MSRVVVRFVNWLCCDNPSQTSRRHYRQLRLDPPVDPLQPLEIVVDDFSGPSVDQYQDFDYIEPPYAHIYQTPAMKLMRDNREDKKRPKPEKPPSNEPKTFHSPLPRRCKPAPPTTKTKLTALKEGVDSPASVIPPATNHNFLTHMTDLMLDLYEDMCASGVFRPGMNMQRCDVAGQRVWMTNDPCLDSWGIVFGAQMLFVEFFLKGVTHVPREQLTFDVRVGAGACLLMALKFHRSDGFYTNISGEPLASYVVSPFLIGEEKLDRNVEPLHKMTAFWNALKKKVVETEMKVLTNCSRVFARLGSHPLVHAEELLHDLWLHPPTIDELAKLDLSFEIVGINDIVETGLPSFSSYTTLRARALVNFFLRSAVRVDFGVLVDGTAAAYALAIIGLACMVAGGPNPTADVLKTALLLLHRMDKIMAKHDPSIDPSFAATDRDSSLATTIASFAVGEDIVATENRTGGYGMLGSPFFVSQSLPKRVLALLGEIDCA